MICIIRPRAIGPGCVFTGLWIASQLFRIVSIVSFVILLGARTSATHVPLRTTAWPDFWWFFDIVLGTQFSRFWCQLGSNLPLNLGPKSTKNLPKRVLNSKPTCMMFWMPFFIDFGSLLGAFSEVLRFKLEARLTKKCIFEGYAEKLYFLLFALAGIKKSRFRGLGKSWKIDATWVENRYKIEQPLSIIFW